MTRIQNASQTTAILYQEPTAAEMRPTRKQVIWANLKEFAVFIAIAVLVFHFLMFWLG